MKKIITLLFILISLKSFGQKDNGDWHWDYCNDFEGPDAVRLKVSLHYLWYFMDPPDNTMDSEYDNIFSNAQECSKYFQREFAEYPYDKKGDVRVDIDIHYHCAPCAAHNKKKNDDESKKKYSIGSRKHNRSVAESAKSCFNGNEDSYNEFLNSIGKIADNVYLDELTCKNGKLFPVWSKQDTNGKQIPLTENDRKSVDDFYKDMQGKSKAREVNKLAQQLRRAQTVKEAEELMKTLSDLFKSGTEAQKSDKRNPSEINNKTFTSEAIPNYSVPNSSFNGITPLTSDLTDPKGNKIEGLRIPNSDGTTTYAYDIDGDSKLDSYVLRNKDGKIINDAENGEISNLSNSKQNDMNWVFQALHQDIKPGEDGYLSHIENSNSPSINTNYRYYFINGILNNYDSGNETATQLSNLTNENIEWIHNQTDNAITDLQEARRYYYGETNIVTEQTAKFIALDLASDKDVRLFAHSEGAAIAYASINNIKSELGSLGVSESKISNLTVITLGGYSPKSEKWSTDGLGPNVINVENNYDLVPILAGNSKNTSHVINASGNVQNVHPMVNYYDWVKIFSNPKLNLNPYYGHQYNANDINHFK